MFRETLSLVTTITKHLKNITKHCYKISDLSEKNTVRG
jgi:hypothetical protein